MRGPDIASRLELLKSYVPSRIVASSIALVQGDPDQISQRGKEQVAVTGTSACNCKPTSATNYGVNQSLCGTLQKKPIKLIVAT